VLHAILVRERAGAVEDLIRRTAADDGRRVTILLPQDPGQAGVAQVADLVKKLAGFVVRHERETGPKETRALPFSSQWQHHNVDVVRGPWNEQYLAQMEAFPNVWAHDDAADASSGAFNFFSQKRDMSIARGKW
jgi:predicted phage terminase large subunit-like protein